MGRFTHWLRSARGKTFLTVTLIGLAGLGGSIPLWNRLEEFHLGVTWLEIFAAVFILGAVEILIRRVEAWMESRDEKDFRRFFGDGVVVKGALAVFPTAEPPMIEGGFSHLVYPSPPRAAVENNGKAKGVKHVVPYEDLRAVLALSALFHKMRVGLAMALDSRFEADWVEDQPLIGIGLGFNHVTARLAATCPDLYSITFESGTDDFLFENRWHGYPKGPVDCALVVRAMDPGATVPHFVCAGRTAAGTQAAGVYLARQWKTLLALYDKNGRDLNRESLAALLRFPQAAPDGAEVDRTCFSSVHNPETTSQARHFLATGEDEAEHIMGV